MTATPEVGHRELGGQTGLTSGLLTGGSDVEAAAELRPGALELWLGSFIMKPTFSLTA